MHYLKRYSKDGYMLDNNYILTIILCAWPQIAVEADEIFSFVLTNLGKIIDYNLMAKILS